MKPKYKCPFCSKSFDSRDIVNHHKNEFHLKRRLLGCRFCTLRFYTDKEERGHVVNAHPEQIKTVWSQLANSILLCPVCKEIFWKKTALRFHLLRFHKKEGRKRCKNFGCNECFWSGKELEVHLEGCKPKHAPKIRVISDAKFTANDEEENVYDAIMDPSSDVEGGGKEPPSAIDRRLAPTHDHFLEGFRCLNLNSYQCCECSSQFDRPDQLLNHLDQHSDADRIVPAGREPFLEQCLVCDFVPPTAFADDDAARRKQMREHVIAKHFSPEEPLEPPESEEEEPMEVHDRSDKISIRIRCKVCFKEFDKEEFLRIHLKYHHTESESQKTLKMLNRCYKCLKSCHNEIQLRLHMSLYCDVTFECDFCKKVFNRIKPLAEHVRVVHRNSPMPVAPTTNGSVVKCTHPGCDRTFSSYNSLDYLNHFGLDHKKTTTTAVITTVNDDDVEVLTDAVRVQAIEYDECPFCDKLLKKGSTPQSLFRHMAHNHKEDCSRNGATCKICNFTANNITIFIEHFKKHVKP